MRNFVDYFIQYTERVSHINNAARSDPKTLITQMERQYRKRIDEIADFLFYDGSEGNKLLMLAGPSSSGKTTTANMLCERLEWLGAKARRISLDEFFLGAEKTPKLEDGTPDFESVEALNIPQMQECLLSLIQKGECMMPRFNFVAQRPYDELVPVKLAENEVVIVEGIHALNPIVTDCLPDESMLKVYISVKQGILEGHDEVIGAYDLRLCRRMVRDMLFRGCSPEETLDMWDNVLAGERKYIQPFKFFADVTINSLHIYEPCVISQIALPLLRRVDEDSPHYERVMELHDKLMKFEQIPAEMVPYNSLLREFIGGGFYK